MEFVPSLGPGADRVMDALGLLPSAIGCIHSAYIDACAGDGDPGEVFLAKLAANHMSVFEAALVWDLISIGPLHTVYRERLAFE